jgi:Amt family ammonium transporter
LVFARKLFCLCCIGGCLADLCLLLSRGTIAGLVAATPASGFIEPWAALLLGAVSGGVCNCHHTVKFLVGIDDALDLFAEHAIGGVIGLLFNGLFGSTAIIALDGVNLEIEGGWIDRNWKQMYKQIAYIVATCAYSFIMTAVLAKGVDMIPGMKVRGSEEDEEVGMDEVEIGEFANDYIEVRRDFSSWNSGAPQHSVGIRHGYPEFDAHEHHAHDLHSTAVTTGVGMNGHTNTTNRNHGGSIAPSVDPILEKQETDSSST